MATGELCNAHDAGDYNAGSWNSVHENSENYWKLTLKIWSPFEGGLWSGLAIDVARNSYILGWDTRC